MTRLSTRVVEEVIFVIMLIAGGMMFQSVILEARGEDANCANKMCKGADAIYWCDEETEVMYEDTTDCVVCAGIGRCISGNNNMCNKGKNDLFFAIATGPPACDCAKAPQDGAVEVTQNVISGEWTNAERKQTMCGEPNASGSGI